MTLGQLHIIYYIRARGKKGGEGGRRGEKGNLAENRKAQRQGSVADTYFNSEGSDAVGDGFHGFGICFLEAGDGCLSVEGIEHDEAGLYALQGFEVGDDVFFASVVEVMALVLALHEHGLDDALSAEEGKALYLLLYVVVPLGSIYEAYICGADGVELEDIVVEVSECFAYLGAAYLSGIREDAHLGCGTELVSDSAHSIDNLGEMRMKGWFAVAGKGKHVGLKSVLLHFLEFAAQAAFHFVGCGKGVLGAPFLVQSAFAIDAVEAA